MKKILFSLLFVLTFFSAGLCSDVHELSAIYNDNNNDVFEYKDKNREDFETDKEYKAYKRNLNLYKKEKYGKILKKSPDSIPALFAMYKEMSGQAKYTEAISYLKHIENLIDSENQNYIRKLLFIEYYKNKEYKTAIDEFFRIKGQKSGLYAYLADCYLYTDNLSNALKYASLVKSGESYYTAQEVKFKVYYRKKDFENAKAAAKKLISLRSDIPDNYLRMAELEKDLNTKLKYLYKARSEAPSIDYISSINLEIIKYEQEKLNKYYNSNNNFVERLDWESIVRNSPSYLNMEYWTQRQDDFFKDCNVCMNKYKGEETYKCFKSIRENQNELTRQLNFIVEQENEESYRKQVMMQNYRHLQQQDKMIRQQRLEIQNQHETNFFLYRQNQAIRKRY